MTRRAHDRATWDERYRQAPLLWSAEPNQFVVQHTAGLRPGRALDVACGEGRNALWLAERGWTVTGIDFSDVAIAKARAAAEQRRLQVELWVGDVTDPAIVEGSYDLVLVAYLQLPSELLGEALRQLVTHVAPGGSFLVVGHHIDNLARGYGGPSDRDSLHDPAGIAEQLSPLAVELATEVERLVVDSRGLRHVAIDSLVLARRA